MSQYSMIQVNLNYPHFRTLIWPVLISSLPSSSSRACSRSCTLSFDATGQTFGSLHRVCCPVALTTTVTTCSSPFVSAATSCRMACHKTSEAPQGLLHYIDMTEDQTNSYAAFCTIDADNVAGNQHVATLLSL